MRNLLRNKFVVALLVVIAVAVMGRSHIAGLLKAQARTVAAASDEIAVEDNVELAEFDAMNSGESAAEPIKPEDWGDLMAMPFAPRDPFLRESVASAPLAINEPVSTLQLPRLRAVSLLGSRTYAVIDHQVVRPGEKVGGFTVQSILRDSVIVSHSEARTAHVLTLHSEAADEQRPGSETSPVDAP